MFVVDMSFIAQLSVTFKLLVFNVIASIVPFEEILALLETLMLSLIFSVFVVRDEFIDTGAFIVTSSFIKTGTSSIRS